MGGETPIAREGLVSSNKNVCGEYAGCMLSFFYKRYVIFLRERKERTILRWILWIYFYFVILCD